MKHSFIISFGSILLALTQVLPAKEGGISMSNPQTLPANVRNREIDAVRNVGSWIRLPINWTDLQPTKDLPVEKWNWKVFDEIIEQAIPDDDSKKLTVLVILGTVPGWANGNGGWAKPARKSEDFEKYCYEVARRYFPKGVSTYQIGNEVNLSHAGWKADGADYFNEFLKPGATGVWKAAQIASAKYNVVMGSLAPNTWNEKSPEPTKFLRDIYEAAGGIEEGNSRWLWGALSYHPYVGPAADPPSADKNLAIVPDQIFQIMLEFSDGEKRLWATEFGTPTHGGQYITDEKKVPLWVDDVVNKWFSYDYAGPLFWYTIRDKNAYGKSTEREDYFGLLHSTFREKKAYGVLKSHFAPE